MNILMVSTFYPPHIGGIEYHVENLSKELVRKGHTIAVLTSSSSKFPSITVSPDGIKVIRVKAHFPLKRIYPPVGNQGFIFNVEDITKEIIKERQIHIVHAHGHHYYLTWKAISAARKLGVPAILTLHGLDTLSRCNAVAKIGEEIFNRTIFRRELSNLGALIGLTPRLTDYAKKYGFASKNFYSIPNGVNYPIFNVNIHKKFSYRQKYDIGLDKTVILFRGRFSRVKGVCELAEAAKQVVQKNNQAFFIFVGDGPLASELVKALQPIKANTRIFGWTPEENLHELYIASNIFILPSKSEALPLTILEAMAAQLTIIATPVGGIPEVLCNYPYKRIIKDDSPLEISEAILHAISESEMVCVREQSFEHGYMDDYDWRKIACRVERIYHSMYDGDLEASPDNFVFLPENCTNSKFKNSLRLHP